MRHLNKMALCMSLRTNTGMEYFKNLPLIGFYEILEQMAEIMKGEEG